MRLPRDDIMGKRAPSESSDWGRIASARLDMDSWQTSATEQSHCEYLFSLHTAQSAAAFAAICAHAHDYPLL